MKCVMCRFPEDVAKMRSDTACCTGCCEDCVCLDRVWRPPRTRRPHPGTPPARNAGRG